ncbi:MAG: hypothetical protein H0W19_03210, partial [Nitrosopumilus sp.]|nr:hypothetical protein [Nitrosopumilus sp.]
TITQSTAPDSFSESPAIGPKINWSFINCGGIAFTGFEIDPMYIKLETKIAANNNVNVLRFCIE